MKSRMVMRWVELKFGILPMNTMKKLRDVKPRLKVLERQNMEPTITKWSETLFCLD